MIPNHITENHKIQTDLPAEIGEAWVSVESELRPKINKQLPLSIQDATMSVFKLQIQIISISLGNYDVIKLVQFGNTAFKRR